MQRKDRSRGLFSKRYEASASGIKPTPAQPHPARDVIEQELEQVPGGWAGSLSRGPTTSVIALKRSSRVQQGYYRLQGPVGGKGILGSGPLARGLGRCFTEKEQAR